MQNTSPLFKKSLTPPPTGRGWGGVHLVCVVMALCGRKSICDCPLTKIFCILLTFLSQGNFCYC